MAFLPLPARAPPKPECAATFPVACHVLLYERAAALLPRLRDCHRSIWPALRPQFFLQVDCAGCWFRCFPSLLSAHTLFFSNSILEIGFLEPYFLVFSSAKIEVRHLEEPWKVTQFLPTSQQTFVDPENRFFFTPEGEKERKLVSTLQYI